MCGYVLDSYPSKTELPEDFLESEIYICNDEVVTVYIDEATCPTCSYTWQDDSNDNPYTIYNNLDLQTGLYWVIRYDSLCNTYAYDDITLYQPSADNLQLPDSITLCENSEVQLYPGMYLENFEWDDGSTEFYRTIDEPGLYWVRTETACGVFYDTTLALPFDLTPYQIGLSDTVFACSASVPVQIPLGNPNLYGYIWSGLYGGYAVEEGPLYVQSFYPCGFVYDSTYVKITPSPIDLIPASIAVCDSSSTWLVLPSNQVNTWENGLVTDSLLVNQQGIYHYSTSIGNACSITDSVSVSFYSLYIDIADTTLCPGDNLTLIPTTNVDNWYWYFNGFYYPGPIEVADTGFYHIIGSNSYCNAFDTFTVSPANNASFNLTLPDSLTACQGDLPLVLTATGDPALAYSWSNGSNAISTQLDEPGWFVLTAEFNCAQMRDSTYLEIFNSPPMTIPSDTVLCANQSITLSGPAASTNTWSTGETADAITIDEAGIYTLSSTDANGCVQLASTEITSSDLYITLDDVLYHCSNDTLLVQAITNGTSFIWSNGSNQSYTTVVSGGTLSFTSSLENCYKTELINIVSTPSPSFSLGNDTTLTAESLTLSAPDDYASYTWNVNGETGPSITISTSGIYTLTVTDENGCQFTDQIVVVMNQPSNESFIEVPDFFTGNKPLTAVYQNVDVYDIKIFDDIGRLVQYHNAFPEVWDGESSDGNPAAGGIYLYVINYSDLSGNKKVKAGNVLFIK